MKSVALPVQIGLGVSVALAGYSGAISFDTLQHRQAMGATPEFSAGSADDMLKEKLRAGDVIVFSRRWYNYHAPQALAIKLYQLLHDTPYDHIGVIVTDKFGEPYLFEQTFFRGYRIRPFEPRILYSRAHQVTAIMLMPRDDGDNVVAAKRTAKLDDFVSKTIAKGGSVSGWYSDFVSFFSPNKPCANLQLLGQVYKCLDMDINSSEKNGKLDCKTLLRRQVNVQEQGVFSQGRYLSKSDVLVRTN